MVSGVYCIVCKDTSVQEVYVGSTEDLNKRIEKHKSDCNNKNNKEHYNLKVYQFIREHRGFDNWKFIWLELFKTDDTIFLKQLEQIWMDSFPKELLLNSCRAYGLDIERRKEYNKEYNKNYNQENKDYFKKKSDERNINIPCPKCFKSISKRNIARHLKICPKNTN